MSAEPSVPYFPAALAPSLACMRMVLAAHGRQVSEQELFPAGLTVDVPPEELRITPPMMEQTLHEHGVGARVRGWGKPRHLRSALALNHDAIVIVGRRRLQGLRSPRRGQTYHPVVVTRIERGRIWFHDPDPERGGANCVVRRSRFRRAWDVGTVFTVLFRYLAMQMPNQLAKLSLPRTWIEIWKPV